MEMNSFDERLYRRRARPGGLVSFGVAVKETDVWVSAVRKLEKETRDLVLAGRYQLESYIRDHPAFATTLEPYPDDPAAPLVVKEMLQAGKRAGVGPMAAVAGAMAEYVGSGLLRFTDQVIVENGGDIFLKASRPVTVSLFAGESPLGGKFGLVIPVRQMPLGVCCSSATVGHSLSVGIADAVCLLSPSSALADAAATALGNRIRHRSDLKRVSDWAGEVEGILGGVVVAGDRMATWGDVALAVL